MKENTTHLILLLLIGLFTIGLTGIVLFSEDGSAYHGNRVPVDPPVPPKVKEPPAPEPCPTSFVDNSGSATGDATSPLLFDALGEALIECDGVYATKQYAQVVEKNDNQAICEAVQGCVFDFTIRAGKKCSGTAAKNCVPDSGDPTDPNTTWTCTVKGEVADYEGYSCERP